jgi:hypothetical protein
MVDPLIDINSQDVLDASSVTDPIAVVRILMSESDSESEPWTV